MFLKSTLVAAAIITCSLVAQAETDGALSTQAPAKPSSGQSNRMENRLGAYIGLAGDPAPSLAGLNAAYNLTDFLRLNAGYGQITVTTGGTLTVNGKSTSLTTTESTMTTVGLGATATVPGWSLTPTAGLSYSRVFVTGDGDFDVAPNNVYAKLGLDWQSKGGFNFGVGAKLALTQKPHNGGYINLGWFFL